LKYQWDEQLARDVIDKAKSVSQSEPNLIKLSSIALGKIASLIND
jgi:hypothetical protein